MRGRKITQFAIGLLFSAGFLYLIAQSIPFDGTKAALTDVNYSWVLAGVTMFAIGYLSRIRRWQLMLKNENPNVGFGRTGLPFMISIAANNVLPFRLGDVMRAFAFSKWLSVPSSSVLATLVAERLLDLLALLAALGLAVMFLGLGEGAIATLLGAGSLLLVALAIVIAIAFVYPQIAQPVVMFFVRLVAPLFGSIGERLSDAIENVFATLKMITRSGRTLALIFWTILAWAGEAGVFLCAAYAVPAMAEPFAAFLAMPVGTLATLLPSSPGYIGTFHYFVIEAAKLTGNGPAAATAFAVVAHLIMWLTATLVGGVCFAIWSLFGFRNER
ncbi:MAG: lysylphosphatidylglycerol synthase transmembrane domain-containing protein [Marinosulfonomonas sp.]